MCPFGVIKGAQIVRRTGRGCAGLIEMLTRSADETLVGAHQVQGDAGGPGRA